MSSRCTIKHDPNRDPHLPSYHLFHDLSAETITQRGVEVPVVWLQLKEVEFECDSHGTVMVSIPKEWAEKLGLLKPSQISNPTS